METVVGGWRIQRGDELVDNVTFPAGRPMVVTAVDGVTVTVSYRWYVVWWWRMRRRISSLIRRR